MTILVVGDIVTDIVAVHSGAFTVGSDTPATITVAGGGSGANTAAWLASLGVAVELVGAVGSDPAGPERVAELVAAGVGCVHVRRTSGRTGTVIVLAHPSERSMINDRGANLLLQPSDVDLALSSVAPRHVHVSGYTLLDPASRPAGLRALAYAGGTRSVDVNSAGPLRSAGPSTVLEWVRG